MDSIDDKKNLSRKRKIQFIPKKKKPRRESKPLADRESKRIVNKHSWRSDPTLLGQEKLTHMNPVERYIFVGFHPDLFRAFVAHKGLEKLQKRNLKTWNAHCVNTIVQCVKSTDCTLEEWINLFYEQRFDIPETILNSEMCNWRKDQETFEKERQVLEDVLLSCPFVILECALNPDQLLVFRKKARSYYFCLFDLHSQSIKEDKTFTISIIKNSTPPAVFKIRQVQQDEEQKKKKRVQSHTDLFLSISIKRMQYHAQRTKETSSQLNTIIPLDLLQLIQEYSFDF